MMIVIEILKCFVVGLIFGAVFCLLKLPIPAPNVIPAVFGILGTTMGFLLFEYMTK